MTPTDTQLDALLERLDAESRNTYPVRGLPIWGTPSKRDQLRLVVLQWLAECQPEAQR
jgi:hypothetical protein